MAQSIKATIQGLLAACQSIYTGQTGPDGAPVLVTFGPTGTYAPSAVVVVASEVRQPVARPTAGTNRSREKEVEIDLIINAWAGGTESVQQIVVEKVDDLTELLEAYFRTSPNETLNGGCREAWVSSIAGPNPSPTADDDGVVTGRQAESTVTVTARIRQ
jgi:hypothetical protein